MERSLPKDADRLQIRLIAVVDKTGEIAAFFRIDDKTPKAHVGLQAKAIIAAFIKKESLFADKPRIFTDKSSGLDLFLCKDSIAYSCVNPSNFKKRKELVFHLFEIRWIGNYRLWSLCTRRDR